VASGPFRRTRSDGRSRRFALVSVLVALAVVLAGCSAVFGPDETEGRIAPPTDHASGDPADDALGWEGGYWYDDAISITHGDGYNESERAALVNRTMARVEQIRGLEFERPVPVEVISREEYRENRSGGGGDATYQAWNDQVWEGLFIVPEGTGSSDSFDDTLGQSVLGYYSPGEESIVLVSDSPTPQVSNATLAHELVHALQDQQFDLGGSPDTQDRQLARSSVIEGEANFVESVYTDRCGDVWSCLPEPESGSGGGSGGDFNRGLYLTIYTPYSAGQSFIESIYDDGAWGAVSDLHDRKPESTEQVIHPDRYPDEDPVNVTVPDRSSDEWSRFDHDPVADTVGEASIYAMFVDNRVVSVSAADFYAYESTPSEGWAGDSLVPYTDGDGDEEDAYVWETRWDSTSDAREFASAYRDLLRSHDADSKGSNVFVVPESDAYGDAFRVVREGQTVRVVNAPTRDQLGAVHERE